jgi:DNA-binding SARP family transcriptional activator
MTRLCCKALEADIEVDYVQDLILRRNLFSKTPPLEIQNWPWRIRIYSLGGFALIKDGKSLSFSKKVQEKPLAMLKAIIALGGLSVSDNQLADLLWPDADGDAAHGAFKTNLHRLRKLLGSHEAIQHVQGKIRLDPKYFWVDAWAFEHMLARADSAWGSAASEADLLKAADLTQRALDLYKGQFLQFDDYISTPLREYFHHQFLQGVQQLGEFWQSREQWEEAICLYEKALTIDSLVEPFYRGLMLCRHQLGQKAKALAAYERCKKLLAKNLNASPSRKTDSLKKSLLNQ